VPRPLVPNPDFPPGASVRVKPMGHGATPNRRRLAGTLGTVVKSNLTTVFVEFPDEKFRENFRPEQLDRV
jgi:hypothetical protein